MHAPLHEALKDAFERVLNSNCFIRGVETEAFESAFAAYCGTHHAVGTGNGLDALHIALRTLGIGPGDEVIVPANTYVATVLAVVHAGADPVLVEPEEESFNLDPETFEEAITPRTKAVIPVHLYGRPCAMARIMDIAARHHILVVEDNAQAHGAEVGGKRTGSWGHLNATSFYPTKNLGALGDAGALTTDSMEYAERARAFCNYGAYHKNVHDECGFNSRLDELHAALLSVKLPHLDRWNADRARLAERYGAELSGVGDLVVPKLTTGAVHHLYVVRTTHRSALIRSLGEAGCATMVHYPTPPHAQSAFADRGWTPDRFPITERLAETSLSLPLYPGMGDRQEHVIELVKAFFDRPGR
ncbi:MAG: DegT/DnrJ/EryC1/StrS family aminotransferase [Flavobacteriales bacterium]|nr:DegT/DnrJ/EryC1/StrS family aminotransferase [Flavobacteriales bacterium]